MSWLRTLLLFLLILNTGHAALDFSCLFEKSASAHSESSHCDSHDTAESEDSQDPHPSREHQGHCASHCTLNMVLSVHTVDLVIRTSEDQKTFKYSFHYKSEFLDRVFQPPKV